MIVNVEDDSGTVKSKRIIDILTEMKDATTYQYLVTRPVHLREAYFQGEPLSVNLFTERIKEVNINGDIKRRWEKDFISAEEALNEHHDSKPLNLLEDEVYEAVKL